MVFGWMWTLKLPFLDSALSGDIIPLVYGDWFPASASPGLIPWEGGAPSVGRGPREPQSRQHLLSRQLLQFLLPAFPMPLAH